MALHTTLSSELPRIITAGGNRTDLADFATHYRADIDSILLDQGAVLLRGFDLPDVAAFQRFVDVMSPSKLDYHYRSTPRSAVADRIFTATEYPRQEEIPLHNENAYQRDWPMRLAFACLVAAESGGETPIADMRRVTASVGRDLLEEFSARRVRYVRHYRPFIDLSWQTVFRTEDKGVVAAYCRDHDIEHEWLDQTTLRTSQVCQGSAAHPATGETFFFNQAHLFHVSALGPDYAKSMIQLFGADRAPRNAYFGDGGAIPTESLETVRRAFRSAAVAAPWQRGDLMLLDNMRMAHGRRPYLGDRKLLAALLDPFSSVAAGANRSEQETN